MKDKKDITYIIDTQGRKYKYIKQLGKDEWRQPAMGDTLIVEGNDSTCVRVIAQEIVYRSSK